jgi:hypothetical protein
MKLGGNTASAPGPTATPHHVTNVVPLHAGSRK